MFRNLNVEITRFVDDSFPGWVECRLVDAHQHEWFFVEKVPVVTSAFLDQTSVYPIPGAIACRFIGTRNDGKTVTVDTDEPWSISSVCGATQFEVFPTQLNQEPH